jgi:uncharacterized protein YuzE
MKITYDPGTDTLQVTFRTNQPVIESDESRPGVILDFGTDGSLVSLEILDASQRVTDANLVEFQVESQVAP